VIPPIKAEKEAVKKKFLSNFFNFNLSHESNPKYFKGLNRIKFFFAIIDILGARYFEKNIVNIIVNGKVQMKRPIRLWEMFLRLKGIKISTITLISTTNVLIHNAVPSNFFGYLTLRINPGA
jgi:hypothetical protein